MSSTKVTLEKIVSLCKRRGFVYQSADIYGGLNGVYDFGPIGSILKQNIKNTWLSELKSYPEEVVLFDGSILGSEKVWQASGHLENFSDPMVDCLNCKKRFREDEISTEKACSSCGIKNWTAPREFQLMFETKLGAVSDQTSKAFLRPETAQSIFINFKNIQDSYRANFPFGVAQIGKSFRNEITPKQFLFRVREFEQMELEFFCHPNDSEKYFEAWLERRQNFYNQLGIKQENLRFRKHESDELSHYSKYCTDVEYKFPFGFKELEGIAHRGSFDLDSHQKASRKDFSALCKKTNEKFIPHVVECSLGVERLFATILFDSYKEEVVNGEERTLLSIHPKIAPVKAAVFPLVKNLSENAVNLFHDLKKKGLEVQFDQSGSIGKRYRRQDEIGTPFCITYDYQSQDDSCVTIRNRDSLQQERISIDMVEVFLKKALTK